MTKYKVKWSMRLGINRRVLNEWEKVHEAIDRRVQLPRSKHVNKRRKLINVESMSYKLRSILIICIILRYFFFMWYNFI